MQYLLKCFLGVILALPLLLSGQNETANKALGLQLGLNSFTMLDRQASPIVYQLNAPKAQLSYQHKNTKRVLEIDAYFSIGLLVAKDQTLPAVLQYPKWNTTKAGLHLHYWKALKAKGNWQQLMGSSFHYDFMIDFNAIGNSPWAMGQGHLDLNYRLQYQFANNNQLHATLGIPILGIFNRMPYYNIPRTQGEVPGVKSFLVEGTTLATWNKYQRIDFALAYALAINDQWQLEPSYQFAWFHYTLTDHIFAYQQQFNMKLLYRF